MNGIKRKIREWYERQDEHEKTAIVAFGIGCPLTFTIFALTLYLLKVMG